MNPIDHRIKTIITASGHRYERVMQGEKVNADCVYISSTCSGEVTPIPTPICGGYKFLPPPLPARACFRPLTLQPAPLFIEADPAQTSF